MTNPNPPAGDYAVLEDARASSLRRLIDSAERGAGLAMAAGDLIIARRHLAVLARDLAALREVLGAPDLRKVHVMTRSEALDSMQKAWREGLAMPAPTPRKDLSHG